MDSKHRGRLQLVVARAGGIGNDRACAMLRYAMDDVLRSGLSLRRRGDQSARGGGTRLRLARRRLGIVPEGKRRRRPGTARRAIRQGGPEQGTCVRHDVPPGRVREVLVGHGQGAEAERQEGGETGAISRKNQGQIPNGEGGA